MRRLITIGLYLCLLIIVAGVAWNLGVDRADGTPSRKLTPTVAVVDGKTTVTVTPTKRTYPKTSPGPDTYTDSRISTKPCRNEDGPGPCFWDAGKAGNGTGNSFWIDADDNTHYLDPSLGR